MHYFCPLFIFIGRVENKLSLEQPLSNSGYLTLLIKLNFPSLSYLSIYAYDSHHCKILAPQSCTIVLAFKWHNLINFNYCNFNPFNWTHLVFTFSAEVWSHLDKDDLAGTLFSPCLSDTIKLSALFFQLMLGDCNGVLHYFPPWFDVLFKRFSLFRGSCFDLL